MEVDRNGLEVLDRDECLRLLAGAAPLGRIGFTSGALPAVLPVNFHLDGERIVVRTGRGTRLAAALRDAVVAFEVDEFDPAADAGWSVAVTGVATELGEPPAPEPGSEPGSERAPGPHRPHRWPVTHWAPAGDEVVLAISTELVSGRRITAARPHRSESAST